MMTQVSLTLSVMLTKVSIHSALYSTNSRMDSSFRWNDENIRRDSSFRWNGKA